MDAGVDAVDTALSLSLDPRPFPPLVPAMTLSLLDASGPLLPNLCFPPHDLAGGGDDAESPLEYSGTDPVGYLETAGGVRPALARALVESESPG